MSERGKYIVIEGQDATGKSTQVERIRKRLDDEGIDSIEFHEPGGTPMADAIRLIIKNGDLARDPETNLLLFTAARREIWHHARQALALGTWVVSARNYYSTLAYQGYGEGVDPAKIMALTEQFLGEKYAHPDWAGILSLEDTNERERRIGMRGPLDAPDTFESRDSDFQERVNNGYLEIAKIYGLEVISAHQPQLTITDAIYASLMRSSSSPEPGS